MPLNPNPNFGAKLKARQSFNLIYRPPLDLNLIIHAYIF